MREPGQCIAELEWMSPNEFLSKVPHPATTLIPASLAEEKYFDKGSIKYITESILSGKKLDPLILDYSDMYHGYPTHEGRHRAYVAKKLGIKKLPVLVIRWKKLENR